MGSDAHVYVVDQDRYATDMVSVAKHSHTNTHGSWGMYGGGRRFCR